MAGSKGGKGKGNFRHRRMRRGQERGKPHGERWRAQPRRRWDSDASWGGKCGGQLRQRILLLCHPTCHFISLKSLPTKVINACKIQSFCYFFKKQNKGNTGTKAPCAVRPEDQKGSCCREVLDVIFVRGDPPMTQASQCNWGAITTGLRWITFVGCREVMGTEYPSKRWMVSAAFTALSVLSLFRCYFKNSALRKVHVNYNRCLD